MFVPRRRWNSLKLLLWFLFQHPRLVTTVIFNLQAIPPRVPGLDCIFRPCQCRCNVTSGGYDVYALGFPRVLLLFACDSPRLSQTLTLQLRINYHGRARCRLMVQKVTLSGTWGSTDAMVYVPDKEVTDGAVVFSHSAIHADTGASVDLAAFALTCSRRCGCDCAAAHSGLAANKSVSKP